jgi:MoaA/NifB/PqqE/SkfB family radical SAM enzyme
MQLGKYVSNTWILRNPAILARVARGFFNALVLNKPTLKTIELFPTYACPLACSMCSVEKYRRIKRPLLEIADYRRVAREGARLGAMSVNILGGEPLVYADLRELVSIFASESYLVNIVTGGTLATRERLADLKRAGLTYIVFSLESMDEAYNDGIRGAGHFKKTMENVDVSVELGLVTGLGLVFQPGERMQHAISVLEYCMRRGITASGGALVAVGRAESSELLSPEEQKTLRGLLRRYPRFTADWALSYYLDQRCPAGKEKVGITAHGDVIACSLNPLGFGNVADEPLSVILGRMNRFSPFARKSPVCLAAEDREYIDTYIAPAYELDRYPIVYTEHPAMTPEREPDLYR